MRLRILLCGALSGALVPTTLYAQESAPSVSPSGDTTGSTEPETETAPTGPQSAEDKKRANARFLATDASQDYRMGRFQEAYDKFNRAYRLVGVPALGVWSARSLRQLDRLVEASERYREVIKAPSDGSAPHEQAIRDAQAELDELLPRIPSLTIQLENASATDVVVKMDGELVDVALVGTKMAINPGKKVIVATRGRETVERTITIFERSNERLQLPFRPGYKAPVRDSEGNVTTINVHQGFTPMETVGIVVMSGGGALLIAGGVTTAIALGQQADLRTNCPSRECGGEFHKDVDKFDTMKLLSTGALIGGAVLGGIGAAIYVTGGAKDDSDPGVALYVQGSHFGLKGAF